jgi:hypothetical protein
MTEFIQRVSDPYDRAARLYPALLVLLPLPVLLVCLYGTKSLFASTVLAILSTCGTAYALGRTARDAGKRLEPGLFAKWGSAPSTQLLRHSDTRFDPHTKERYHHVISKGLGRPMPSRQQEAVDPPAADDLYRAGTLWLIGRTSDAKRYPEVFRENVAFGFQRNALGLRPAGMAVAAVCLLWALLYGGVLAVSAPWLDMTAWGRLQPPPLVAIVVSATMLLAWVLVFREPPVQRVALAYADRLIRSCDKIAAAEINTLAATEATPSPSASRRVRKRRTEPESEKA